MKLRRKRRIRSGVKAAGTIAAVGAAAVGAAALARKKPQAMRRAAAKAGLGASFAGMASNVPGPVGAASSVVNLGLGAFQAGATAGASLAQNRRGVARVKQLKLSIAARSKQIQKTAKRVSELKAVRNSFESERQSLLGRMAGQGTSAQKRSLRSLDTAIKQKSAQISTAQAKQSALIKRNASLTKGLKKIEGLLGGSYNTAEKIYKGVEQTNQQFRAGRRQTSSLRPKGKRGPKADPRSWQERLGLKKDEAEREDKPCGKSGIPDNAKCSKPTGARTAAKAVAAAALLAGGAVALKRRKQIRNRFRRTGLTPYQKRELEKMRAKGSGKYGARGWRKTGESFRPDAQERTDVVFENKELHARVKAEAKKKFKVYPSAYANAWMVKEYKKRGGTFRNDDLKKWFNEKWVRMSAKGEILGPCGDREKGEGKPRCLPEAKARALSKKERAKTVRAKREADPKKNRSGAAKMVPNTFDVEYRGEEFSGYNKPKRTPNHPKKSHAVLAKEGGQIKLIRFGQQGVKGSPPKKNESESYTARRRSFKARHAKNIAKGKMSAAYWANRSKW